MPPFLSRSKGVWVSLLQLPCRSGFPSGVRGATQGLALTGAFAGACAPAGANGIAERPSARASAPASENALCRECKVLFIVIDSCIGFRVLILVGLALTNKNARRQPRIRVFSFVS